MSTQSNEPAFMTRREGDALHDSAFEPHSSFMFEEPAADEEFRNMQRNIASLNVLADNQHNFQQSMDETHGQGNMSGMNEQYNPNFVNPFVFNQGNISPHSPSWPNGQQSLDMSSHSMQAEIVNGRSVSVSHQFGQITPPNEDPPKGFSAVSSQQADTSAPAQATMSAKSERARNAANQRHAKAKKARKESARKDSQDSPDADDGDQLDDDRRERYREKNRLAAAKCRAKKKVNTEDLEETARIASATNSKLRAEERELRDLFSSLRDQALAHDPTQGCGCSAIHSYNMHKAQETARGAVGGLHGLMIPSPTQRSLESASPSTVGAPSRTQSFSGLRPQFQKHSARSQSMAGPLGYMHGGDMMQQPTSATGEMGGSGYDFGRSPSTADAENFPEYMQGPVDGQQMFHNR